MARFTCPNCRKELRAADSQAGRPVRCPACAKKLTMPEAPAEPKPPEEGETPRPRRRRRKRDRPQSRQALMEQARLQIVLVAAAVLGMHLFGLVYLLLLPPPEELPVRRVGETVRKLSKQLPPEAGEPRDAEDDDRDREAARPVFSVEGKGALLFWRVGGGCAEGLLLLCLYLRQHWARTVLAIWFLLAGFCGLTGALCGTLGFGMLTFVPLPALGPALVFLTVLNTLVQLAVDWGACLLLIKSESLDAYATRK